MARDKVLTVDNRVTVALGRQDGTAFPPAEHAGILSALALHLEHLGCGQRSGSFVIDGLHSLTPGKPVVVIQVPLPVATKGGARDEGELDPVVAAGVVLSSSSILVSWWSPSVVVGDVQFAYGVSQ